MLGGRSAAEEKARQQIHRLERDARLVIRLLSEELKQQPLESPTGDHGNYFAVTGDLWRKLVEHCLNVALLLAWGGFGSVIVVHRAAYEVAINLIYLIKQGNKIKNAVLFRTRSLLEVAEVLHDQPSGTEARQILGKIPRQILDELEKYKKAGRPWSGKSIKQMAEAVGVVGHDRLYSLQSWEAHGRIAGYDLEELKAEGDLRRLKFEAKRKPEDVEALASNAWRILLRTYETVAQDWLDKVPPLTT